MYNPTSFLLKLKSHQRARRVAEIFGGRWNLLHGFIRFWEVTEGMRSPSRGFLLPIILLFYIPYFFSLVLKEKLVALILWNVQSRLQQVLSECSNVDSFLRIDDLGNSVKLTYEFTMVWMHLCVHFTISSSILLNEFSSILVTATRLMIYVSFPALWSISPMFFFLHNFLNLFLDAYVEHMKEELVAVEAESSKISNEIEVLKRTNIEGNLFVYVLIYNLFVYVLIYTF